MLAGLDPGILKMRGGGGFAMRHLGWVEAASESFTKCKNLWPFAARKSYTPPAMVLHELMYSEQ